jgi:hypothetical protein
LQRRCVGEAHPETIDDDRTSWPSHWCLKSRGGISFLLAKKESGSQKFVEFRFSFFSDFKFEISWEIGFRPRGFT